MRRGFASGPPRDRRSSAATGGEAQRPGPPRPGAAAAAALLDPGRARRFPVGSPLPSPPRTQRGGRPDLAERWGGRAGQGRTGLLESRREAREKSHRFPRPALRPRGKVASGRKGAGLRDAPAAAPGAPAAPWALHFAGRAATLRSASRPRSSASPPPCCCRRRFPTGHQVGPGLRRWLRGRVPPEGGGAAPGAILPPFCQLGVRDLLGEEEGGTS